MLINRDHDLPHEARQEADNYSSQRRNRNADNDPGPQIRSESGVRGPGAEGHQRDDHTG
jgi:hypothetical protein